MRDPDFQNYLASLLQSARDAGVSVSVIDRAQIGISYLEEVVERDRHQPEVVIPIWDYLDRAVSAARVRRGQSSAATWKNTLAPISTNFGVDVSFLLAIWGLESNFGQIMGDIPVLSALATLAFDGRRRALFEGEFVAALTILEQGDVTVDRMFGSWAGAMGHTQFMPSSFVRDAIDFDGDGRRDIWGESPTDALASSANFLRSAGWKSDLPCIIPVAIPDGFDCTLADQDYSRPPAFWQERGIGVPPITGDDPLSLILPVGARGPAFLTTSNFRALFSYNRAVPYVLAVWLLAEQIAGVRPTLPEWPRDMRILSRPEISNLQMLLNAGGYLDESPDGLIGPNSRAAIRAAQTSFGMAADGFPTLDLIDALRG